jgi:SAM-dependent methyltransferase
VRALENFLETFVTEGREAPAEETPAKRWLDVLPCTGIVTELLSRHRKGFDFDIVERTPEVGSFVAKRVRRGAGVFAWPEPEGDCTPPPENTYDVVTCLYRLEGLATADRSKLVADMKRWVKPGGRILIGYVNRRSFHQATELLRRRRGGPGGVEYVLSPDPNIGPFEALAPGAVEALFTGEGLEIEQRLGMQAVPQPGEIAFRTRNFSAGPRAVVSVFARALGWVGKVPGLGSRRGRFQFFSARESITSLS